MRYVDLTRMVISYEPKYSRGDDDLYDPLPKGSFFLMFIGNIELLTEERMKLGITIMGMVICIFTKLKTQTGDMNFVFNMMMEKLTFVLVQLTVT